MTSRLRSYRWYVAVPPRSDAVAARGAVSGFSAALRHEPPFYQLPFVPFALVPLPDPASASIGFGTDDANPSVHQWLPARTPSLVFPLLPAPHPFGPQPAGREHGCVSLSTV